MCGYKKANKYGKRIDGALLDFIHPLQNNASCYSQLVLPVITPLVAPTYSSSNIRQLCLEKVTYWLEDLNSPLTWRTSRAPSSFKEHIVLPQRPFI
jgi:hypothetical protein